jgi:hypothetical protein
MRFWTRGGPVRTRAITVLSQDSPIARGSPHCAFSRLHDASFPDDGVQLVLEPFASAPPFAGLSAEEVFGRLHGQARSDPNGRCKVANASMAPEAHPNVSRHPVASRPPESRTCSPSDR